MSDPCKATVDTTEGEEALNQLKDHSEAVRLDVVGTIRKTYTSLILLGDIMGIAIPQWFNAMITSVFMAQQSAAAMGRALEAASVASGGLYLAQAGVLFLSASMLFAQGMYLQNTRNEIVSKLNSTSQLLNVWA